MKRLRAIAWLLSILIVFYAIPTSVYSLFTTDGGLTTDLNYEQVNMRDTDAADDASALGELEHLRTPSTKYVRMTDGSYRALEYGFPVHYLDGNGQYKEYDNTLIQEGNLMTGAAYYRNRASDISVRFAANSVGEYLYAIADGIYRIEVAPYTPSGDAEIMSGIQSDGPDAIIGDSEPIRATSAVVRETERKEGTSDLFREIQRVDGYASALCYEEILSDTDYEYLLCGSTLKENIIVRRARDRYVYRYAMRLTNLTASLQDDQTVIFRNAEGKTVFSVPRGYMYDADGAQSDAVTYSLSQRSGMTILTVTADSNWINDADRAFPVTIDPTVSHGKYLSDDVRDASVYENQPNVNTASNQYLLCGYSPDANLGNMETYIAMNQLPELPASSVIVKGTLNLKQLADTGSWNVYGGNASSLTLGVRMIGNDWNENTITWNNKPGENVSDYFDYQTVSRDTAGTMIYWDITSCFMDWYEAKYLPASSAWQNRGVMLTAISPQTDASHAHVGFYSSENPYRYSDTEPMFTISYRDTKGLENRWNYSSQDAKTAGTGHVNLFNGNLVFVSSGISTAGSILPVNVTQIYNSYQSRYDHTGTALDAVHSADFSAMFMGKGFKLSLWESIVPVTIGGTSWYVYYDADGTELYFKQGTDGDYVSEDGLALTLKVQSDSAEEERYRLHDDYGNDKLFDASGYLREIRDSLGNRKKLVYTNGRITSVDYYPAGTTEAITQLTLLYNSAGGLYRIINAQDTTQYVTYSYSETYNGTAASATNTGYLRWIRYSDGTAYRFYYNADGTLFRALDNTSQLGLRYRYDERGRVTDVSQYDPSGDYRFTVSYTYNQLQASVTSTMQPTRTTYVFDTMGRTTCAYTTDLSDSFIDMSSCTLYGASGAVYHTEPGSRKHNALTTSSVVGRYNANLVKNGNMENAYHYSMSDGSAVVVSEDDAYLGAKSFAVTQSTSNTSKWVDQTVSLQPGTYTLSAYVKSSGLYAPYAGNGIFIRMGETYTTISRSTGGWERISVTATVASAQNVTLSVGLVNASGTVYIDCLQLEAGDAPSAYNMVENGRFDSDYGWIYSSASYSPYHVVFVGGKYNSMSHVRQSIQLNRSSDTTFHFSGWYTCKAASYDISDPDNTRVSGLYCDLVYDDNTIETHIIPPNTRYAGPQYLNGAIVPRRANATIKYAVIYGILKNCQATATFDDLCFIEDAAQTYSYDDNGKLIQASAGDGSTQSMVYQGVNGADLTSITNADGSHYNITYQTDSDGNSTHRPETVTDALGVTATYTYDSYGNVSGTVISNPQNSVVISASSAYSYYGNYTSSVTDAYGNTVQYDYNTARGLLNYVTDANNRRQTYLYDVRGRLTGLFSDKNKDGVRDSDERGVQYVYDAKGYLCQIISGGQSYSMTYDSFGYMTALTVGNSSTPLATYQYDHTTGLLTSTTYADGTVISNTYDELGRVCAVRYNNVLCYTFVYNANGALYSHTDVRNGTSYVYRYDSIGRLIGGEEINASRMRVYFNNRYDSVGRLQLHDYTVGGSTKSEYYSYKSTSGLLGQKVFENFHILNMAYDEFGRVSSVTLDRSGTSGGKLKKVYVYEINTVNGVTQTGTRVKRVEYYVGTQLVDSYDYIYNGSGNVSGYTALGQTTLYYSYDDLNQLTSQIHMDSPTSPVIDYQYTYDRNGNLLTKRKGQETEKSYGYVNPDWKDQLYSYNGKGTFAYDANGNPLSYYNGSQYTFTWKDGRRLATASALGGYLSMSYSYNADGIRVSKNVNDVRHEYYLDGSRIVKETWADQTLEFLYDENKSVYCIVYTGGDGAGRYYLIKNLQGDVTRILNNNLETVAQYVYDPWGKLVYILDADGEPNSGISIANINPIRYRGYYFDMETGFYYLNARYYDPALGRFINPDVLVTSGRGISDHNMYAYCGNDPINRLDPTGEAWWNWAAAIVTVAAVAVAAVAVTVATCGAAAPAIAAASGGIVGGISAGTAASVTTGAMVVASVSTAVAVTSVVVEKTVEKVTKRDNTVYYLVDDRGTVQYVGRTNNTDKRMAAHRANPYRSGLRMKIVASGLSLPEARSLEQAGMLYHHTINTKDKMNNQINGVAPKYWGAFKEIASGTTKYGWNQMSNEILYWTGN